MKMEDAIQLVKSDLRFRERLLQVWGLTWEEAYRCIEKAFTEWTVEDRKTLPPGFVGEAGYQKVDEL